MGHIFLSQPNYDRIILAEEKKKVTKSYSTLS